MQKREGAVCAIKLVAKQVHAAKKADYAMVVELCLFARLSFVCLPGFTALFPAKHGSFQRTDA